MNINLTKLHIAIEKAKGVVEDEVLKETQEVALRVHQAIVLATPVDTGRARSNWLPSLNSPIRSVSITEDVSGASILSLGEDVTKRAKLGDSIHFTNNLPYIGALNDGHSAQAPAGFIEKAAQAAEGV